MNKLVYKAEDINNILNFLDRLEVRVYKNMKQIMNIFRILSNPLEVLKPEESELKEDV